MNDAQRVVVLHHGQVSARGNPEEIKAHPEVRDCYLTHRKDDGHTGSQGRQETAA